MTGAEWPELETAFGRALRRGDALVGEEWLEYVRALEKLMVEMVEVTKASRRITQYKAMSGTPSLPLMPREELPESDLDGNDKKKVVETECVCGHCELRHMTNGACMNDECMCAEFVPKGAE